MILNTQKNKLTIEDLRRYAQVFKTAGFEDGDPVLLYQNDRDEWEFEV